ncbi:aldehyde dehydrogenase family protein [Haloferula rosea]|uniref:Aldehyde dehydrogenase family protein n=1 Tax=Haloferula rosea TaxID=490093 RepID=A0A934RD14_9BACT|nr:aldehyde dehydrogenase family protein [Haloferula rosea]MBK1826796.1 aldehyde dehydrogenase family protein [Haloferula rosea]
MNIPILRLGESYESLDLVELDLGARGTLTTHTANPGLIRRDLLKVAKAKAALDAIPAETLADYCEQAAELFLHADLPCGDAMQSPQDYIESLSALTRLPHTLVRMNMGKVHAAMSEIRTVIGGLTRQLPLEIFDKGLTSIGPRASARPGESSLTINYFPATTSLGVSLPSNAPAVNSLWIPAPVMKIPVFLKPGREDPFTPLRIVQAMIQAGFPKEAFGYYPTTHEGGDTIVTHCGRGISFGSDVTVKKYAPYESVSVHGTGRSKILIGEDMIERWPEFLDVIVQSISANGGRSCINTSAILVPSHRDELADAIAKRLAEIKPLARDDDNALLCGFANPAMADGIDELITAQLKEDGAEDLTAKHRDGDRKVEAFDQFYLNPTLVSCTDKDHPLANTEFMFPYASIVEMPQSEMVGSIGETLVVSAFTEDQNFINELLLSPDIERLNLGAYPTNRVQWEQPHEGNLFEFLYHRRAIQGDVAIA